MAYIILLLASAVLEADVTRSQTQSKSLGVHGTRAFKEIHEKCSWFAGVVRKQFKGADHEMGFK